MKRICCLLFALLPVVAMAYPIEVAKQFNGAEISVTTQEIDHNMAALMLYNYGQAEAQCTAIFRNRPEAPRTRRAVIAPGATSNMAIKFSRSVIRLRVQLTCELQ